LFTDLITIVCKKVANSKGKLTLFRAHTTRCIHGHTAVLMTHEHGRVSVYIGRLRVYTAHIHGRVYGP